MNNPRTYGQAPFHIAVIHGGPGAAGEMRTVARDLSTAIGILKPLQTQKSVQGQIDELADVLKTHADLPVTLIGHSWGAWLAYFLAAEHPELVHKLILVGAPAFEQKYVKNLSDTRMSRLTPAERDEIDALFKQLEDSTVTQEQKNVHFARFGSLFSKTDTYDPIDEPRETINVQADIYNCVWPQADELRKSGRLLEIGKSIRCPVLAIHGEYDPTPAAGVESPLKNIIKKFRFIILKNCGHTPWIERQARLNFYEILKTELG